MLPVILAVVTYGTRWTSSVQPAVAANGGIGRPGVVGHRANRSTGAPSNIDAGHLVLVVLRDTLEVTHSLDSYLSWM